MTICDDDSLIVPETAPIKTERRGCATNLILTALLLEAARMVDDGFETFDIEAAAKKAFGIPKGFLVQMDEIGIPNAIDAMEYMADISQPEDPLTKVYHNFFTPANSCRQILDEFNNAENKPSVVWLTEKDAKRKPFDFMLVDSLSKRFMAVGFAVSTELVDSEIIDMSDVEKLCEETLGWKEGPFTMMNALGIEESLQIVTEKMQFSHRKEINFPVSRLLITQAQKNSPWRIHT
jgi:enoyl-CoA hydratase/3-hydroxyacyl-CoA dehydrogenase